MKYVFRIAIALLLVVGLVLTLRNNKKELKLEIANAHVLIDSIPVRTHVAKLESTHRVINTVGQVKLADEVYVVSRVQGEVKRIDAKVGQKIRKGELIAHVDDYYAQQEYAMAKKVHDQLSADLLRYKELAELNAITPQQLEQLELQLDGAKTKMKSLNKRLEDYKIKAPLDGVINQLFISRGSAIGQGMPVCELIGGEYLKIEASINPKVAHELKTGLAATFISDFGHGYTYTGVLSALGKKPGKFGGVAAQFVLNDSINKQAHIGSILNIEIKVPKKEVILLPRKALTTLNGKKGVFWVAENNTVSFEEIKYVDFDDNYIKLLNNKWVDRTIVVEGNYMLEQGDLVRVLN